MPDTIFFNQSLKIMGIRTDANFDKCCKIFVVFFCQVKGEGDSEQAHTSIVLVTALFC